ncbi:cell division protein DedD [Budvicia diplopodorum]|uniref:cell division protein DedD n=1 Tax=Budvicia diplopodorum TaxID=1119056 RepID=UPI0013590CB8|nr:cell division protein DedD [Budvicia diplopodorum]
MASQFQNRLIGAVVIVAVGVIILPSLFDGKKKHYEDEFASIPIVPKEGDDQNAEILPTVNHSLPPENGATQTAGNGQPDASRVESPPLASTTAGNNSAPANPDVVPPAPTEQTKPAESRRVEPKPVESKPAEAKPKPAETKPVQTKPVEAKPVQTKPVETKPAEAKPAETKPAEAEKPKEKPPVGQAFIVQLGALKNADKVNEIVATLKLSGYRVYTVPTVPVQGKVTRVVVGPDPSRQKLEAALPELNRLSGLNGEVKAFSTVR